MFVPLRTSAGPARAATQPRRGLTILGVVLTLVILAVLVALLLPATRSARPAARRTQCANNLKQVVLAFHSYHDDYQALPPAYTVDANGKPLHSWRTLLLPYLDEEAVYSKIDLTKPWDDPANAAACNTRLAIYQCPEVWSSTNRTTYLAVVTADSMLQPVSSRRLRSPSEALLVLETDAAHAVPWMAPLDADEKLVLEYGNKTPLPHSAGAQGGFVDGTVRALEPDTPPAERQAWTSAAVREKAANSRTAR